MLSSFRPVAVRASAHGGMLAATALVFLGCNSKENAVLATGSSLGANRPVPEVCAHLALGQIGVNPALDFSQLLPQGSAVDRLLASATAHGKAFQPVLPRHFRNQPATVAPALIEGPDGQLGIFLSVITSEHGDFAQIIHGDGAPQLIPFDEFQTLNITRAWTLPEASQPVEHKIGDAVLAVDKLWHNFKLTKPYSNAVATFTLLNKSDVPLQLGRITTSCGCTLVEPPSLLLLDSGTSTELSVTVRTADMTRIKQSVTMQVIESNSGAKRQITFMLLGSQFKSLSVAPEVVRFEGLVMAGQPTCRTVRLTPSQFDGFCVQSIDTGDLPLKASLTQVDPANNDLHEGGYTLDLTTVPSHLSPGVRRGTIRVHTTSKLRSLIELPVELNVRSRIELIPSIVSFGLVSKGSTSDDEVFLVATDGQPFGARILACPANCLATIKQDRDSVTLAVRANFTRSGRFEDRILIEVVTDMWKETISLPCMAVVEP